MILTLLLAASAALQPQLLNPDLALHDAALICGTTSADDACVQRTVESFYVVRDALADPKLGKRDRSSLVTLMAAQTRQDRTFWAVVLDGWTGRNFPVPRGYQGGDPAVLKAAKEAAWDLSHYSPPSRLTVTASCRSSTYNNGRSSTTVCNVQ